MWTKEQALQELHALARQIDSLKPHGKHSAEHTKWVFKVVRVLGEVFGEQSPYCVTFRGFPWTHPGGYMVSALEYDAAVDRKNQEAYGEQVEMSRGLLEAAREHLAEADDIQAVFTARSSTRVATGVVAVLNLLERKVRKVVRSTPEKEREVQDAVESLLIGADIEHVREGNAIVYSSKTYIPDFTLVQLDLVVEVKFCKTADTEKRLIAEINDDILAYQTRHATAIFIVYDLSHIRDVDKFTSSFEEHQNVIVRVVKH